MWHWFLQTLWSLVRSTLSMVGVSEQNEMLFTRQRAQFWLQPWVLVTMISQPRHSWACPSRAKCTAVAPPLNPFCHDFSVQAHMVLSNSFEAGALQWSPEPPHRAYWINNLSGRVCHSEHFSQPTKPCVVHSIQKLSEEVVCVMILAHDVLSPLAIIRLSLLGIDACTQPCHCAVSLRETIGKSSNWGK